MFSTERWSLKFITHVIVIFATLLQVKRASSLCIEGSQYYSDVEKICLPCTKCTSPKIVITPCSDFSNTLCGLPRFSKDLDLVGISQEKIPSRKELSHKWEEKKSKNKFRKSRKKKYFKKGKRYKDFKKFKRKLNVNKKSNVSDINRPTSLLDKNENATLLTLNYKENQKENFEFSKKKNVNIEQQNLKPVVSEDVKLPFTTENVELPNATEYFELPTTTELTQIPVFTEHVEKDESSTTSDDKKKGFSVMNVGKYVVLSAVGTANILLLLVAIVNIISCICWKKRSRGKRNAFFCNQNLPSPSQKPVKCRFTAVLPSKSSPQYTNVDSYLNPIISSSSSCEASDDTPPISDNSCSTVLSQSSTSQEINRADNVNLGPSNTERDSSAREPLINTTPNHEVIESANTIQLYSRMPSPNPFTMDRLLESRRAVGYPSVENNLYVETWCSSPSPVLPRSQDSSVTPSPATCLRKPFSTYSSNSSSPLTTRTFRATPAFSSFQPLRSS
ncbi:hypothetical protein Anas_09680 [Armadillidium nasatum]|uniref:TNFR-Cys domain-containing protein n=1 Tax=Armadillidium nasatum TaxID=96803 RepID=A0A5N5SN60_9CRUS|nr:hypothetical protein Anas_09680 [Armadillidium nasatum]